MTSESKLVLRKPLRIYLDDMRGLPPECSRDEGWIILRDGESLIGLIESVGLERIVEISFDHDLGSPRYLDGYQTILWLERHVRDNGYWYIPIMHVHSANPVGAMNIRCVIERIENYANNEATAHDPTDPRN